MTVPSTRDRLSGEIDQIMETKKDNPGKTAPDDAIPLMDVQAPPAQNGVKEKGSVQKGNDDADQVTVTITEAPKVEITSTPPPQVDIT